MIGGVRVAAVQLEVKLGDVEANLEASERLARAAAADGAGMVALPEFFTTGAEHPAPARPTLVPAQRERARGRARPARYRVVN